MPGAVVRYTFKYLCFSEQFLVSSYLDEAWCQLLFQAESPSLFSCCTEFDLSLLLPTIEVFRCLNHKIGKTESAVFELSGFSVLKVLTWPFVSAQHAYASIFRLN